MNIFPRLVAFQRSGLTGGGDDGNRTHYLLNAIQALSQVSYAPIEILSRFDPWKLNNDLELISTFFGFLQKYELLPQKLLTFSIERR